MWMQNQELQEEEEKRFWNSGRILRCSNLCSKCQDSQVFIGRLNKIVQLVLEKKKKKKKKLIILLNRALREWTGEFSDSIILFPQWEEIFLGKISPIALLQATSGPIFSSHMPKYYKTFLKVQC